LHAERGEEDEAERDAQRHLQRAGEQHGGASRGHLADVDLEADDEEEQDQPDLRHGRDAGLVLDEAKTDRADDHAGREVRDDQRLPEAPGHRSDQRRETDADADAREKVGRDVHRSTIAIS
jgi:hypothetical protein